MAWHDQLFPNLVAAIRGGDGSVKPIKFEGGTVNYKLMKAATAWIAEPDFDTAAALLSLLREMKEVGHMSLRGAQGVGCEQGSPGMHWTFSVGSVVGALKWAFKRGDEPVAAACLGFLSDEVALDEAFVWEDRVILPAPRVKDEKNQAPTDKYRDVFLKLAQGVSIKKNEAYWKQDQSIAVATFREIAEAYRERARPPRPFPKLYLPIRRADLPDGGFIAWIDKTEEAVQAMGRDGCNWVRCATDGVTYGYDWSPIPLHNEAPAPPVQPPAPEPPAPSVQPPTAPPAPGPVPPTPAPPVTPPGPDPSRELREDLERLALKYAAARGIDPLYLMLLQLLIQRLRK